MQILGKRSKILLIAVAIAMLVAVGVSFAMWDLTAVKATSGNLSTYANAKVGDVIEFGRYYQTGNKVRDEENAEYEKTPIEWIVVDKDERSGQLTLMSKYILAAGSYFGNYYNNAANEPGYHYKSDCIEVGKNPYNQAYVESTARAFLNNLERKDLGGDSYSVADGYKTSVTSSEITGKLLTSVGFSNNSYNYDEIYKRPINSVEYIKRPATRGFYDEAFSNEEKARIIPKTIAGNIGFRWPNKGNTPSQMSYINGVVDKVWLPSATEINAMSTSVEYKDEASSTVFEYFKGKTGTALENMLKTERTPFVVNNSKAMNYSIPVYQYQSAEINEDIHDKSNSTDWYWLRTTVSSYYAVVRIVYGTGKVGGHNSDFSYVGVRPCVILKY